MFFLWQHSSQDSCRRAHACDVLALATVRNRARRECPPLFAQRHIRVADPAHGRASPFPAQCRRFDSVYGKTTTRPVRNGHKLSPDFATITLAARPTNQK